MSKTHAVPVDPSLAVVLDTLLSERSVTRAARRLGVTQSAVSHRLKQLREQLGDALLVPGTSGLVPTARAQAIAGPLHKALTELTEALTVERPFDPFTTARTFSLACRDFGEFVVLGTLLDLASQRAPAASFAVHTPDLGWRDALGSGSLDLYVGIPVPATAGLRQKRLLREPFVVVGRKGHEAFRRRLTLERYLELSHVVISPEGRPRTRLDGMLEERGLSRRVVLRVPTFVSSPFLVARTELVLTVPLSLAREAARHVKLEWAALPIALEPTEVVMIWHERAEEDVGHRWLRSLVSEATNRLKGPKRKAHA